MKLAQEQLKTRSIFSTYRSDIGKVKQFPTFCRQIELLVSSGLSIRESLLTLSNDSTDRYFQKLATTLLSDMSNGQSFMTGLNTLLPDYLRFPFSSAPVIPNVAEFLHAMGEFYSQQYESFIKLRASLVYPMCLVMLSMGLMGVFIVVLLPMFATFIGDASMLPTYFRWIYQVLMGVQANFEWVVVGMMGALVGGIVGRRWSRQLIIGWLFSRGESDYLWMMGMLLGSGVSLKHCVESFCDTSDTRLKCHFSKVRRCLYQTGCFAMAWTSAFPLSHMHTILLMQAQSSGNFASLLIQVSQAIRLARQNRRQKILGALKPTLIIGIAVLVGHMMALFYMPLLGSLDAV